MRPRGIRPQIVVAYNIDVDAEVRRLEQGGELHRTKARPLNAPLAARFTTLANVHKTRTIYGFNAKPAARLRRVSNVNPSTAMGFPRVAVSTTRSNENMLESTVTTKHYLGIVIIIIKYTLLSPSRIGRRLNPRITVHSCILPTLYHSLPLSCPTQYVAISVKTSPMMTGLAISP